MTQTFRNNADRSRYELVEDGLTAFADYRISGGNIYIDHVESPVPLRGAGTAGRLMQALADDVRGRGLKIIPICGYAAAWLRRHPETRDLLT
jgi:predicted GNAT family acetyltransferase